MSEKVFSWLAAAVICSLLLAAGCAPPAQEPDVTKVKPEEPMPEPPTDEAVTLALKFTSGDSTTYRVVAERKKSVTFEGSLSTDPAFKGGQTSDRVEMVFTQQIESVNDISNAVVKITIEGLNYLSKDKDVTIFDFDSSREEDRNNPLAKIIGQSYTIEVGPDGQVVRVVDAKQAQAAVGGRASAAIIASALLKPDVIKQRHGIPALPPTDKNQLHTGDEWSSVKTLSFGMLGAKSYERIYMLKEIEDSGSHRTAIVEMNAIPTSETAEDLHKEQAIAAFSEMFDNIETYTGRLKLDLTDGKVQEYIEELRSEWVFLDAAAKKEDNKVPDVLRMAATRLVSLERID